MRPHANNEIEAKKNKNKTDDWLDLQKNCVERMRALMQL